MKNILIILLLVFLFGCKSLQKTQTNSVIKDSVKTEYLKTGTVTIDTTKVDGKVIKITEVKYFPPSKDSVTKNTAQIDDQNYAGDIDYIKTTTISKSSEKKGITKADSTISKKEDSKKNEVVNNKTDVAKSPYRWLWICISIVVGGGVLVYLLSQIKSLATAFKPLGWIQKIFK